MKVSVLFSGGKDSSLAAILLEPFFEVELVTCTFGIIPTGDIAAKTAGELNFPHRTLLLDRSVLESAYETIMEDGFPKKAINHIHEKAVEALASDPEVLVIADGTRRDDRVPVLDLPRARSIEDRFGVQYTCPLKGYGRKTVDLLVERYLVIEEGLSEYTVKADYETELRELIKQRTGEDKIRELFPVHVQSHVLARKKLQ